MIWAEETIAQLRTLSDEGHTTSEIAKRLGCGKNSITGKRRRLGIADRESPIRVSDVTDEEILSALREGRSTNEVSNLLRVDYQRVRLLRDAA